MKKLILSAAALLLAAVMLLGCTAFAAGGGKTLRVGVRKNLANFSVYNEQADTYYGFEADLAAALADAMGYDGVEFVGVEPEEREVVLENGQADCLIAAYSYTDERAEQFDLSEPYYHDTGRVMIEKSTLFETYADLRGCTVAVREGTTAAANIAAKLAAEGLIASAGDIGSFLTVVTYDSYEAMNAALEYGDVDALCADGCITLPWLDSERTYLDEAYSEEDYVIAAVKGDAMTGKIAAALAVITDNGTLAQLEAKWGISDAEA